MNTEQLINFFNRAIHPLKTTVMLLNGKAVVKAVDDSKDIQEVQLSALAGESLDKIPRVQDFGFSSNPPLGSEGIILSLGGSRENVVAIKVDNRVVRIKNLASGETVIFTDDGTFLHLKKSGQVHLKTATKVLVEAPDAEFTGNVKVLGNLHVVGNVLVNGAVQGDTTINATQVVGAGQYSGPLGGAPMPVTMAVPLQSSSTIESTGDITSGGDVISSATSHSAIKTKFNAHKHQENNVAGPTGVPDQII